MYKDPLDQIGKALGIAQSIYGIKTAYEQGKLRDIQAEREKRSMASDEVGLSQKQLAFEKDDLGFTLAKEGKILETEFNKDYYGMDDAEVSRFNKKFGDDVFLPKVKVKVFDPDKNETRTVTAVNKSTFEKAMESVQRMRELKAKTTSEKSADPVGKPTGSTFVAAGFADRISDANFTIAELEKKGFDRSETGTALRSSLTSKLGEFGEYFKDEDLKSYDQAKRNFVNAVLRRESGAAIADSEFLSADLQYFPVAGDTPKTIAQKRLNRLRAYESLKREADYGLTGVITPMAAGKSSIIPTQKPSYTGDKKPTDPQAFTDWYLNQ
jgi:hypothetical protein